MKAFAELSVAEMAEELRGLACSDKEGDRRYPYHIYLKMIDHLENLALRYENNKSKNERECWCGKDIEHYDEHDYDGVRQR